MEKEITLNIDVASSIGYIRDVKVRQQYGGKLYFINELFAGEFLCDENYKNVADENLLMMLEHRLYNATSKELCFDEFHNTLKRISETTLLLQRFEDKQEAITYLVNETGLSENECAFAYDFYIKMFEGDQKHE